MGDVVPAQFATDNSDTVFAGWHDPDLMLNGWATPSFTREVTQQIIDWVHTDNEHLADALDRITFRWDGDVLLMSEPRYEVVDWPITLDTDGRYPVGDGWTWQVIETSMTATKED